MSSATLVRHVNRRRAARAVPARAVAAASVEAQPGNVGRSGLGSGPRTGLDAGPGKQGPGEQGSGEQGPGHDQVPALQALGCRCPLRADAGTVLAYHPRLGWHDPAENPHDENRRGW